MTQINELVKRLRAGDVCYMARAAAELSADAPAQQTQISEEVREEHYSGA